MSKEKQYRTKLLGAHTFQCCQNTDKLMCQAGVQGPTRNHNTGISCCTWDGAQRIPSPAARADLAESSSMTLGTDTA